MADRLVSQVAADVAAFIERQQELMFNERDFQMQLAVSLLQSGRYDDVDVEYYIPNVHAVKAGYEWDSDIRLDVVVRSGANYVVVELKYPTRRVVSNIQRFGRVLEDVEIVKNHGAQDIVSYNIWKDVRRVELMRKMYPDAVVGGLAVILTNDSYYPRGPKPGTLSEAYSTAEGRTAHGRMEWTRESKTTLGYPPFCLDGTYTVRWLDTEIEGNRFHYAIIAV